MGYLYLSGAQNKFAKLKDYDDWEILDEHQDVLNSIAKKYGLKVSRESVNEGDSVIALYYEMHLFDAFYDGEAFEVDFTVNTIADFDEKAEKFLEELEKSEELSTFHGLSWSKTAVRYFVTS